MIRCINLKNGITDLGPFEIGNGARILQIEAIGKSGTSVTVFRCTDTTNTLQERIVDEEESSVYETNGCVKVKILETVLSSIGRASGTYLGGVSTENTDRGAFFLSSSDKILCENENLDDGSLKIRLFVEC